MEEKETVVRLRGLPWSATASNILTFFEGCSIENEEEGIHLLKLADGRSTGEAFVEFATEEDLEKGLSRSKNYIGRRYIDVFKVKRSEMNYVLKKMDDTVPEKGDLPIVRLRGLPFGCSKEEVANFFIGLQIAPNGITFLTDHLGRCTGEGFVQFLSHDSITKALSKHKQSIGHRYIEVFQSSIAELRSAITRSIRYQAMMFPPALKFGVPNSMLIRGPPLDVHSKRFNYLGQFHNSAQNGRHFEDFHNSNGFSRGYHVGRGKTFGQPCSISSNPQFFNSYSPPRTGGAKRPFIGGYRYKPHESTTGHSVHMRGLPFTATEQDIAEFFSPLNLVNIKIHTNSSGRPSGDADVDFESHEVAVEAMKKNRATMSKRYIELFLRPPTSSHTNFGAFNNKASNKV